MVELPHRPIDLCAVSLKHPTVLTSGTTNLGLSWCIAQKILGRATSFPLPAISIYAAIRVNTFFAYNESHLCLASLKMYVLLEGFEEKQF